jgi:competence protein ComGC
LNRAPAISDDFVASAESHHDDESRSTKKQLSAQTARSTTIDHVRRFTQGARMKWSKTLNVRFQSSRPMARGFTQLELLLVLSVIFLNVAVFLPFVQRGGETARRNQCQHNLKQIGQATANYQETFRSYPSGFEVSSEGNYLGWGWNFRILPYIDAADVYKKIEPHFAEGIHGLPDAPEFHRRLPLLWCPSDMGTETVPHAMVVIAGVVDGIVSEGTEDWQSRLPHSSYFGNVGYLQLEVGGIQYNSAGTPTSTVPLVNKGSLGHFGTIRSAKHRYCDQKNFGGYFGQNSQVSPADVVDGTSNTIMIGERYSPADPLASVVGHGTWLGVPDCTRAQGLAMALADASVRINIGMPLREQTTGFGSLHDGGAFFALGDGSVRFISQGIDVVLFRNLSLINDSFMERRSLPATFL